MPWFNVRLQWFWRASLIPFFLHLSKSFNVMNFSTCSSSLHWLKSEWTFFLTSLAEFRSCGTFSFFLRHIFRLFMKGKSSSRKSTFFSWRLPIAFAPTLAFLFTFELGFTFSLNCSNLPKNAIGTDFSKRSEIGAFLENYMGFFEQKLGIFQKRYMSQIFRMRFKRYFSWKSENLWMRPVHPCGKSRCMKISN